MKHAASLSFWNREHRSRFVAKGSKHRAVVLSRPERSGPISTALCLRKARSPNSDALQVLAFATNEEVGLADLCEPDVPRGGSRGTS
jgi:hypothetical protein